MKGSDVALPRCWDFRVIASIAGSPTRFMNDIAVAPPVGLCGHPHLLWAPPVGYRDVEPEIWRVVTTVTGSAPADERARQPVPLEPGTRLRHVQSDWTMQGCAGCEDVLVWERFLVLDGPHAGRCVGFCSRTRGPRTTAQSPRVWRPSDPRSASGGSPPAACEVGQDRRVAARRAPAKGGRFRVRQMLRDGART